MIDHLLLVEWDTISYQHIEKPLKICDILLKCESSLILVEYLLWVPDLATFFLHAPSDVPS